jgi:uracil-DNA glycosylase
MKKIVKALARFLENLLIFCTPHLIFVLGETWCSSYFGASCAEKNIKKIIQKRKTKSPVNPTSAFLASRIQYLRYCHSAISIVLCSNLL